MVPVVSFQWFRFGVLGFSICPAAMLVFLAGISCFQVTLLFLRGMRGQTTYKFRACFVVIVVSYAK